MIELNPHALGIIDTLEYAGLIVGDAEGAKDAQGQIITPQVIVYLVPGGSLDGTAANPEEWGDVRFKVIAVGRLPREARFVADRVAEALDAGVLVDGRVVQRVRPTEPWGVVERDPGITPHLYYADRTYGMWTFVDVYADES